MYEAADTLMHGVRDAGVALVERKLSNSTVRDLVSISDADWLVACRRFNATQLLAKQRGRLQACVASIAKMFGVTDRTVRRWLAIYRKNPAIVALLPKPKGQRVGTRRLSPDMERLLNDVIDVWAAKAEHFPVSWILEECKRLTRSARLTMPSRRAIDTRLRDRGIDGLSRRQFVQRPHAAVSGAGKTMLLEKFQRDHLKTCEERSGRRKIVSAELPPVPLLRSLYAEIIRSLCADVSPTMRLHELETRAIGMLQHAAPRMLLIDEIQHLLSCGIRDQRAAMNAIKFLANKLRNSIVAAGTHEALHVMRADPQIARRFEQLELPVWTESHELRRFIDGYLALLPIKRSSAAIDKRFVEYLLELSEGVTGRIIDVLRRAALQGIADKTQKVGLVQLQVVGAKIPSVVGQRT